MKRFVVDLGLVQKVALEYGKRGKMPLDLQYFIQQLIHTATGNLPLGDFMIQDSFSANIYDLSEAELKEFMKLIGLQVGSVNTAHNTTTIKIVDYVHD